MIRWATSPVDLPAGGWPAFSSVESAETESDMLEEIEEIGTKVDSESSAWDLEKCIKWQGEIV